MLKSKSTTDTLTQTAISYRDNMNSLHKHNRTEMKTVKSAKSVQSALSDRKRLGGKTCHASQR